ncbi:beta-ribofuranosylaminobenzene 5'-phosphate synthase family protein [Nocardioides sp. LS1]|uniref:beta-ribofuranosylaminobenzene 5'-phosphate synthase family protein n=1 Tax=Nocardioides sp. LS1 TaxID=1027620 RepID=UPI000F625CFA|nr:beta-ribofuranosylaminobenzene 5'-phosphate synthase family protein [Nocardioides sp. LS1]GCD92130.1 hypothetical protein NLS1_41360 [Nocardioides sp. LS1]
MVAPLTRVSAPSRLHMGLIDLAHATPRTYGGFGLMIDHPGVIVTGRPAKVTTLSGDLSLPERDVLTRIVETLCSAHALPGCDIEIVAQPRAHAGLGRGTALRLAALACVAAGSEIAIDSDEIRRLSERGGTSGVGVSGFFAGGLIVDAGHRGRRAFAPSADVHPTSTPPVISRIELDPRWFVTLALPTTKGKSGVGESDFFQRSTPVPASDVLSQLALLYHGILPALVERDLVAAGTHYAQFSRLGFKSLEIAASPASLSAIELLSTIAPFVGMSSVGPCVFAISEESILRRATSRLPCNYTVIETRANNVGHVICDA